MSKPFETKLPRLTSNLQSSVRQQYMSKQVLQILLIVALAFLPLILLGWLTGLLVLRQALIMTGSSLVIAVELWFVHRGMWRSSGTLLPLYVLLIAVELNYREGFVTSAVMIYLVAIILTAVLGKIQAQWWVLAWSIIAYLTLGMIHPNCNLKTQAVFVTVSCGTFLGVALLQWLSLGQLERTITQMHTLTLDLARSEDRYRRVVENASESILVLQGERIKFFNQNLIHVLGFSPTELQDRSILQLIHPQDHPIAIAHYEMHDKPSSDPFVVRVLDHAGQTHWVEVRTIPIEWEGQPATLNLATDITARQEAELTQREHDTEREQLLANLARRNVQLQTAAEISRSANTILDPDTLIVRAVNLIQEQFNFYYVGLFLLDAEGRFAVLKAGTGEAGRQMLAQGHRLAVGGESMIGQCVADARARIALDVGQASVRFDNPLLPLTRSEMALPLISRGQCIGALTVQSAQEAAFSDEDIAALQTMADQLAVAIENARLFRQLDEQLGQSQQLNQALEQVQRLLQSITDSMPSALMALDAYGRVLLWNPAAEKITGSAMDKDNLQPLWDHCVQLSQYQSMVEQVLQDGQIAHRHRDRLNTPDGEIYCDVSVFPLISEVVEGVVLRIDDVSERVQLEEMMLQSAKMASIGRLAAGVAHEINNPLGAIIQSAQMLQLALDTTHARTRERLTRYGINVDGLARYLIERGVQEYLQGIRTTGERAAKIVADLLSFSRYRPAEIASYDLNELVDQTLELAATDYNLSKQYDFRNINIVRQFAPQLPRVWCDGPQIQQVILNLVRNAAQAMSSAHDKLSATRTDWRPQLVLRTSRGNSHLILEVEDNGPGLSPTAQSRLFEPFSTTKGVGEGTGLGLWLCWSIIVERHKGTIRYEPGEQGGARFVIALPIHSASTQGGASTPFK